MFKQNVYMSIPKVGLPKNIGRVTCLMYMPTIFFADIQNYFLFILTERSIPLSAASFLAYGLENTLPPEGALGGAGAAGVVGTETAGVGAGAGVGADGVGVGAIGAAGVAAAATGGAV